MDRLKKVNFSIRVRIFLTFQLQYQISIFICSYIHVPYVLMLQRKLDNLIKEKEEVIKENQSLVKQIEDIKSSTSTLSHLSGPFEEFHAFITNLIYSCRSEDNIRNYTRAGYKRKGFQDTG